MNTNSWQQEHSDPIPIFWELLLQCAPSKSRFDLDAQSHRNNAARRLTLASFQVSVFDKPVLLVSNSQPHEHLHRCYYKFSGPRPTFSHRFHHGLTLKIGRARLCPGSLSYDSSAQPSNPVLRE